MKPIFILTLLSTVLFSDIFDIHSFEADFIQTVKNEKGNTLKYTGHVKAMKPQYALWSYKEPTSKLIYIINNKATIIEPDLEQVIVKQLHINLDFFNILQKAEKIDTETYLATFQSINYTLKTDKSNLKSINYMDELDNHISITFVKQVNNKQMNKKEFIPSIPLDYDIING